MAVNRRNNGLLIGQPFPVRGNTEANRQTITVQSTDDPKVRIY
jgi:hypothetical protein